jgi:hypothetical protein
MPGPDPIDLILAKARGASDQQVAFWTEHMIELVAAWKNHYTRFDRDALLQLSVKSLMEGDNTREDLCYQVMVAIDFIARKLT